MGARPSVTKAAIEQVWQTFFDGSTPPATRGSLLEHGDQFTHELAAVASSPVSKGASAQVTSVSLDAAESATVTFSLELNGSPVLKGVKGTAVLVNGAWKVSAASFCQLASLLGAVPKACPATGK
jgi:hypothetical protein